MNIAKKIENWCNKHITHNRDDEGDFGIRVILHIPIGFLIGALFPLSFPLLYSFHKYEKNEDMHVKDEAWKDIFGCLVGEAVGLVVLVITLLVLFL